MRTGLEYKKLGDILIFDKRFNGLPAGSQKKVASFNHVSAERLKKLVVDGGNVRLLSTGLFSGYTTKELAGDALSEGEVITIPTGGKANIKYYNGQFVDSGNIIAITEQKEVNLKYIYYYLSAHQDDVNACYRGQIIKHPYMPDVYNMIVPMPSLSIQNMIVSSLDWMNDIIEKKKEQVKQLDDLAQSVFYDTFGDPITNEKGWDIVEMRTLFDIGSSKRVFESQWTDVGVPFYRAREIVRLSRKEPIESPIFISEPLFKEYSTKYGIPSEGDIMVTAVGTLGVCYLVKKTDRFYFKDGNLLWFKNKGLCDTRFIKDQFTTDFVKNQIQGNANAAVVGTYTITNANKTRVVLPPLNLQKEYVGKVEAIERQKDLINQSIREVQTLFDSRMAYWFAE